MQIAKYKEIENTKIGQLDLGPPTCRADMLAITPFRHYSSVCFCLHIVATGCPFERRPRKTVSCYAGDSVNMQDKTTESCA